MTPVGLICALPAEAKAFAGRPISAGSIARIDPFMIAVTGMGADRAHAGADRLLATGARTLVSWGTAGALVPGMRAGDLLLPTSVQYKAQSFDVDPLLRQRVLERLPSTMHAAQGTLAQAAQVLRSRDDKLRLQAQTDAVAVDMESATVGMAAQAAGVPFLAVRAIVDAYDVSLPACVIDATDEFGHTQLVTLVLGLLKQPRALVDLLRLGAAFRAALVTLRAATPALKASLGAA